jgi:DNA-binding MarR family transcriptional regulator
LNDCPRTVKTGFMHPLRSVQIGRLDASLGYWLRFVDCHVGHALGRRLGKFGVTVSEWLVLRELYRIGPSSQRLLSMELGITESPIARLVDRLDAKFLVERSRVPFGRRQWQLSLTSVGRALVPTLEEVVRENDAEFFGYLTGAEREQLTAMLKRVARRHRLKPMPLET